MSLRIAKPKGGTAAWRVSLWGSIAFAIGTAFAFWFLQQFLAQEIQNRADAWLTGELGVLSDVAERTPANQLHNTVVREVAELASREVPRDEAEAGPMDRAVFFLQITGNGDLKLHTGAASGTVASDAIKQAHLGPQLPADVRLSGFTVPFRVAEARLSNGDTIYLALSSEHERRVLHRLRAEFTALWFLIIALSGHLRRPDASRPLRRRSECSGLGRSGWLPRFTNASRSTSRITAGVSGAHASLPNLRSHLCLKSMLRRHSLR